LTYEAPPFKFTRHVAGACQVKYRGGAGKKQAHKAAEGVKGMEKAENEFYPPIKAKGNGSDDTKQEKGDVNLNEYKKQISEERELLHRQLELLAERSKHCTDNKELVELSAQMVSIYTTLKNVNCHR
jgi:hypothetical protein